MYKKTIDYIIRVIDMAWIPKDTDNMDYVEFLQYLVNNNLTIEDIPWLEE